MGRVKHIHFVGIGGVGMAPIAEILLSEGYTISGSDLSENALTQRLAQLGATIYPQHASENGQEADVLVYSSAVTEDNPEYSAAKARGIPILQRAQMLAELMRFRQGLAIAGTHGKTTTTSLLASILQHAKLDPSYVIGGKLNSSGTHAERGEGPHIVVEADESDASFLSLLPLMAVVTNIDSDHMSTYNNDINVLKQTFVDFLHHMPFYGTAVLCIDDPLVADIEPKIQRSKLRYGFSQQADFQISNFNQQGMVSHFTITDKGREESFDIELSMPGEYNVLNATAALVIARECGVAPAVIADALKTFSGVGRRLQFHGQVEFKPGQTATLYEDYGHHPREIAVTVKALKEAYPTQRLIVVFQPHRYSRTQDCFQEFVEVLSDIDDLLLLPVYPAGEAPIDGINSASLAEAIQAHADKQPLCVSLDTLDQSMRELVKESDVLLFSGAGNIGAHAVMLSKTYASPAVA